jgi:hypothetical protein
MDCFLLLTGTEAGASGEDELVVDSEDGLDGCCKFSSVELLFRMWMLEYIFILFFFQSST